MSKYLAVSVLVVALISVTACKSKTEVQDPNSLTPSSDAAVPEPDMGTPNIETAQTDTLPAMPDTAAPEPSTPVQSLGASSSGLGR